MQRQNQLAQAAWGPGGTRRRGLLPPPPPAFPVAAARAYLSAASGGVVGLEALEEVVRTMRGKLQVGGTGGVGADSSDSSDRSARGCHLGGVWQRLSGRIRGGAHESNQAGEESENTSNLHYLRHFLAWPV